MDLVIIMMNVVQLSLESCSTVESMEKPYVFPSYETLSLKVRSERDKEGGK